MSSFYLLELHIALRAAAAMRARKQFLQSFKQKKSSRCGTPHVFTDLQGDQPCTNSVTSNALLVEEAPNSSSSTDQGFVPRTAQVDRAVQEASINHQETQVEA